MEKENLVLKRIHQRIERFINEGDFDDSLFDRAYRRGLEHALVIIKEYEFSNEEV